MKNYRLTQRGKIVFTGLFIALIVALVLMVTYFNKQIDPVNKELMINTDEIEVSNEDPVKGEDENKETLESETTDNDDKTINTSTGPSSEIKVESVTNSSTEIKIDENGQEEIEKSELEEEIKSDGSAEIIELESLDSLLTLYYLPDEYKVNINDMLELDAYSDLAKANEKQIVIEGNYHIGKGYDKKMFEHLSYYRAKNVQNYLIDKGIDESRILIIDNKDTKALNKDGSDTQVGLNRRVDIYFNESN